jgi:hypothetical protein
VAARDRDSEVAQQLLALVFVDLHRGSVGEVIGERFVRNRPASAPTWLAQGPAIARGKAGAI